MKATNKYRLIHLFILAIGIASSAGIVLIGFKRGEVTWYIYLNMWLNGALVMGFALDFHYDFYRKVNSEFIKLIDDLIRLNDRMLNLFNGQKDEAKNDV